MAEHRVAALETKLAASGAAAQDVEEAANVVQRLAGLREGCKQKEVQLGKGFGQFKKKCKFRWPLSCCANSRVAADDKIQEVLELSRAGALGSQTLEATAAKQAIILDGQVFLESNVSKMEVWQY